MINGTMHGKAYGTGKRKNAIARVYLTPGTGKWDVNGRTLGDYFPVLLVHISSLSPRPTRSAPLMSGRWSMVAASRDRRARCASPSPGRSSPLMASIGSSCGPPAC